MTTLIITKVSQGSIGLYLKWDSSKMWCNSLQVNTSVNRTMTRVTYKTSVKLYFTLMRSLCFWWPMSSLTVLHRVITVKSTRRWKLKSGGNLDQSPAGRRILKPNGKTLFLLLWRSPLVIHDVHMMIKRMLYISSPVWKWHCCFTHREELPTIYKCPHQGCTAVYRGADGMKVLHHHHHHSCLQSTQSLCLCDSETH